MRNLKMRVLAVSVFLTTGFGLALADTGIRLMVPDLPFAFSGMASFNLHLQVEQSVQEHTEGILTFESCGQELTLGYQGELKKELLTPVALVPGLQYFPIEVKDQLERDCDLHFHLWDKKKETLLATTGIGLKYKSCYAPIDADQELILSGHLADLPQDDQHASRWEQQKTIPLFPQNKAHQVNTHKSNTAHLEEIKKIYDRVLEHQLFSDLELTLESFMQPLTRIELAQMIVAMSEKLDWELQSEKVCVYQDMSDASEAMRLTAQQVCQLDIMGIHPDLSALDNFMPDILVTRDQMVTVVSRILRWDLYNQGQTFYDQHIQQAHKIWLITKVDPAMIELRAYFYLMLYRATQQQLFSPVQKENSSQSEQKEEKKSGWSLW